MSREVILIAPVQDIKLNCRSDLLRCADFHVIGKGREQDNGKGRAFILHNKMQYRLSDGDIDSTDTIL